MSTKNSESSSQLIMGGMVTEHDVFVACLRRIASKGGKRNSAKQTAARNANLVKAREARSEKRRRREAGEDV